MVPSEISNTTVIFVIFICFWCLTYKNLPGEDLIMVAKIDIIIDIYKRVVVKITKSPVTG